MAVPGSSTGSWQQEENGKRKKEKGTFLPLNNDISSSLLYGELLMLRVPV